MELHSKPVIPEYLEKIIRYSCSKWREKVKLAMCTEMLSRMEVLFINLAMTISLSEALMVSLKPHVGLSPQEYSEGDWKCEVALPTSFKEANNMGAAGIGHCNGILCLSFEHRPRSKEVILYNPATREFKRVPDSVMRLQSSYALAVGMGYDPKTDDFKVVRIWSVDTGVYTTNRVEEYALSTDSWTRLYNTNARDFLFGDDCFALFFKGTYYWWASKHRDKSSSVILGMDIGDEVFNVVSVPDKVDISKPNGRSLAVWRESVCLICCSCTCVDIWVMMMEDGFGWWKMQSIRVLEEVKPLVFWKGSELLMEMMWSGKINSYDVDKEKIENVKMEGNPVRFSSQAVNYVATLVSIKGDNYLT
ncbi:F-box/kelch-repeat protein [Senna tora]|uniref:F-box/kelch-repeat protein n=1 Tax=Senna tora TaxID=362788 RepID=A0A834TES6_9FABA|nr:F-box/kelch-repeat protein [Senna tora]